MGPTLVNVPVRVNERSDVVIPKDINLSGKTTRINLLGVLELTPGMRHVDVQTEVTRLGSKLVNDPVLSTPEFDAWVIEGRFSTDPQTIYYFEHGIYLGSWRPAE